MEPSLSLVYNSHQGDGQLGMGWGLGGLSAIDRCPQTVAQDGVRGRVDYDSGDRFCLDGERLVAIVGDYGDEDTEYRTEIDSFVRVTSHGTAGSGPEWFEVKTKSGNRIEFGNTADSRIEGYGRAEARLWAQNRIADSAGNYMTVSYVEKKGQVYPDRIDYTGNAAVSPYASVRFEYEDRDDGLVDWFAGSEVLTQERMTNVKTFVSSTLVSDYRVIYLVDGLPEPSRVEKIERCDIAGDCFPAIYPTWNATGAGQVATTVYNAPKTTGDFSAFKSSTGDINGDGVTDVVWTFESTTNGLRAYAALGNGNGTFETTVYSAPKTTGDYSQYEAALGDFDGDGLVDIVWTLESASNGLRAYVALSDGDGSFSAALWSAPKTTGNYTQYRRHVGDFNGDGVTDLAWTFETATIGVRAYVSSGDGDGTFATAVWNAPLNTGDYTAYDPALGDFNGDGLVDIAWTFESATNGLRAYVSLSTGNGNLASAIYNAPKTTGDMTSYSPTVGNINGDGISDIVWTESGTSGFKVRAALGQGDGTLKSAKWSRPKDSGDMSAYAAALGDFNGDGLTDLMWTFESSSNGLRAYTALSEGNGGFADASYNAPKTTGDFSLFEPSLGDFNGDGVSDLVWTFESSINGLRAYSSLAVVPEDHGLIASIDAGLGADITLDYRPLTDSAVYAKDTGVEACTGLSCVDIQFPMRIVSEVETDDGIGGQHRTTYMYGGAKIDLKGRGFLGFRWMNAKDEQTEVLTTTEYRQDFPYIGQVDYSHTYTTDGQDDTHLTVLDSTWSTLSLNAGKTEFPYVSQNVSETYEHDDGVNNLPIATVTSTSTYDTHGNPTDITVSTAGDGQIFTEATTSTYENDTANWFLGRLVCAQVQSMVPGPVSATRTSGFEYDATTGLLNREVVEPVSADITEPAGIADCVTTSTDSDITLVTDYTHDAFGNRATVTVSGAGITTRSTTTTWGERDAADVVTANGRFAVTVANALGHDELREHDGRFGAVKRLDGPNRVRTTWEHDNFGRLTKEIRADGTETRSAYRLCTEAGMSCPTAGVEATTVQDFTTATGTAITQEQLVYTDILGREVRSEAAGFTGERVFADTTYDALGRTVLVTRPYFDGDTSYATTFEYDVTGRLNKEITPGGKTTETFYRGIPIAGEGVVTEVKVTFANPLTQTTVTQRAERHSNAIGELSEVIEDLGGADEAATSYVYDAFGNLETTTDDAGNTVTMDYDIRGRKTDMDDPDMGEWTYAYNVLGELTRQTDAEGQATDSTYDVLGRIKTRTDDATGTPVVTTWTYDSNGKKGTLGDVSMPGYTETHTYDSLIRPISVSRTIESNAYQTDTDYDADTGRADTLTYPSNFAVQHVYRSGTGYLEKVQSTDPTPLVYWQGHDYDAAGQTLDEAFGNGVDTVRTYAPETGLLTHLDTWAAADDPTDPPSAQELEFTFDALGNLHKRDDIRQSTYEEFTYDGLNRLTASTLYGIPGAPIAKTYTYDTIGNILTKTGVTGTYLYGTGNDAGAGDAGPHAVTNANGHTYAYDDNGNLTGVIGTNARTLTWSTYNKPESITVTGSSDGSTFTYGPDRARIVHEQTVGTVITKRVYAGSIYERLTKTGDPNTDIHYIYAGGTRVAQYTVTLNVDPNDDPTVYLHQDHLGSVDTITDELGVVTERLSYDPHGKRRNADWTDAVTSITPANTPRGFTDHEHLDNLGLIHMNGRVYDPVLGRFLSADPFVQFPHSTQGLNRYSYVNNNPLSYTDPSGYFFGGLLRSIGKLIKPVRKAAKAVTKVVAKNKVVQAVATIAAGIGCGPAGPACAAATSAVFTAVNGGSFGDVFKSAVISYASSVAFQQIGQTSDFFRTAGQVNVQRIVAHGVVGGLSAEAQGGDFRSGFISAAISKSFAGQIHDLAGKNVVLGAAISAVVGGTVSELGGGKFANGAVTAAFGYLFNQLGEGSSRQAQIRISIGFTPALKYGNHALIIGEDGRGAFATRAGPYFHDDGYTAIRATSGAYNSQFPDAPSDVHTVQSVGSLDMSLVEFQTAADSLTATVNASAYGYDGLVSNSNTYASAFLGHLGLSAQPIVWAPGWNSKFSPGRSVSARADVRDR